ncbi:MAG: SsrA-binding protein SmpB [Gammaproteobacteria bacterium]
MKKSAGNNAIAENRRARHDYSIEERYETGLVLEGWEVKALRAGRASIAEAHAILRAGEAWLIGSNIAPLPSASTHVKPEADRTRKLLLKASELRHLAGAVERRGYTLIPLRLYWKSGRAKLELGLGKGKKQHDKRQAEKERDWSREQGRLLRERR